MTKNEFMRQYTVDSGMRTNMFAEGRLVVMPCNCQEENCMGWAVVVNMPVCITIHIDQTLRNMGHESRL